MIRWGLLGTAHVNRRLIPVMRAARRSTLVAVASRDARRARAYAGEWGIPIAHDSYEALLRDAGIDAVYLPLPNALHVEWTLRAVDAGKHVLCEKPLALSAEDVDRVGAVADARERVVAEAFMYRHEPLTAKVLELIAEGTIGAVTMIAAGFTFEQHRADDVRLDAALGGGSLWDVGCYPVSAIRLIAGAEPTEVVGWAALGSTGVDETFTGLLRFARGVVASVHCSFRSHHRMWLDIHGKDGTMHVPDPYRPAANAQIAIRRGDQVRSVAVIGSSTLFLRQVEDFVSAALDRRPPVMTLRDSRGNAAALAALHESARIGRPVTLGTKSRVEPTRT
jgi:D-xylose 1-dehydrogenase (NADP+, D-xylono-1,5-lactone-forming)